MSSVHAVYFSPTGTTRKLTLTVADGLAKALGRTVCVTDITVPESRAGALHFSQDDIAVIAFPVYAGRLPNLLLPYIKTLRGQDTPALPLVVFGNRDYDDALLELGLLLEDQGFRCFAAAAFVGEHAFSRVLGAGRPDDADLDKASSFAAAAAEKIRSRVFPQSIRELLHENERALKPYYTPRDRYGNPVNILKVKPKLDAEKCTRCGKCVSLCPLGSIDPEDVADIRGICMKCGACIKGCPQGARYYDDKGYLYHQHELEELYARRAEPSLFL